MADKQYVGAVTVKRRTGIANYWAYYRDTTGKQRLRSLKTNNLKEALARAKKINDSLESGTDERLDTVRRNRATTFASVMDAYLKVTTWSPSTLDRNLFRIKLINNRWGDVPVAQITPTTSASISKNWSRVAPSLPATATSPSYAKSSDTPLIMH